MIGKISKKYDILKLNKGIPDWASPLHDCFLRLAKSSHTNKIPKTD